MPQENANKLVFAHININSLNKSELLVDQVKRNIDVLMTSETKIIDDSFPLAEFSNKWFQ